MLIILNFLAVLKLILEELLFVGLYPVLESLYIETIVEAYLVQEYHGCLGVEQVNV